MTGVTETSETHGAYKVTESKKTRMSNISERTVCPTSLHAFYRGFKKPTVPTTNQRGTNPRHVKMQIYVRFMGNTVLGCTYF